MRAWLVSTTSSLTPRVPARDHGILFGCSNSLPPPAQLSNPGLACLSSHYETSTRALQASDLTCGLTTYAYPVALWASSALLPPLVSPKECSHRAPFVHRGLFSRYSYLTSPHASSDALSRVQSCRPILQVFPIISVGASIQQQ